MDTRRFNPIRGRLAALAALAAGGLTRAEARALTPPPPEKTPRRRRKPAPAPRQYASTWGQEPVQTPFRDLDDPKPTMARRASKKTVW